MPLFSIIIPVYNRSGFIKSAIESVLNQNFREFEIIIVDDGSTDDLKSVVENYRKDFRISYYYQENAGVCAARNFGASIAKGEYLIFLDSDDVVDSRWLHDFSENIKRGKFDFILCGIKIKFSSEHFRYKAPIYPFLKHKNREVYIPGSFCITNKLFQRVGGYDESIKYGENTELGLRIKQEYPKVGLIESANLIYDASGEGGSKNWKNKLDSTLYILEKHKEYFNNDAKGKFNYYSISAYAAFKCGEYQLGKRLYRNALFIKPFNYKAIIRYLVSLNIFLARFIWNLNK